MADNTNIKAIYELKIIIKFVLKLRIRLISVWGTLCISLNKVVMMALDCWEYGKKQTDDRLGKSFEINHCRWSSSWSDYACDDSVSLQWHLFCAYIL